MGPRLKTLKAKDRRRFLRFVNQLTPRRSVINGRDLSGVEHRMWYSDSAFMGNLKLHDIQWPWPMGWSSNVKSTPTWVGSRARVHVGTIDRSEPKGFWHTPTRRNDKAKKRQTKPGRR